MTDSPLASSNIARHLARMAATQPEAAALKVPRGRTRDSRIDYLTLSFAQLAAEAGAWQADLQARGVRPGDRTLVMVRPGLPLIASVFALFACGAVPIVIDPGMGRKHFLACVARSQPKVLVGIPLARLLSHVFRRAFRSVHVRVPASSNPTARRSIAAGTPNSATSFAPIATGPNDAAAILFTSGSTGAPKGVCYEHRMFEAQVQLIRATYDIRPGEIDLPLLPIFALFNPALGMTTIVPELDPSRPAAADPARLVQAIQQENVTNSFGSPTLWSNLARYCETHGQRLPSLKRVLSAGAPVPPHLWRRLAAILPNGELHSPYGATEALPVSSIRAAEVLGGTASLTLAGAGTCVGRILAANTVKIIALDAGDVRELAETRELPVGEIGEIIVAGPSVTETYDQLPEVTRRSKIVETLSSAPAGRRIYHRLGDAGYLDAQDRLWFCGRAVERVCPPDQPPLFTEQVEPHFNAHPAVRRSALVEVASTSGAQPALVVELNDQARRAPSYPELAYALREHGRNHPYGSRIERFYFHPGFPVDVRHNAKIHRLTLARWTATATAYTGEKAATP